MPKDLTRNPYKNMEKKADVIKDKMRKHKARGMRRKTNIILRVLTLAGADKRYKCPGLGIK